MSHGPGSTLIDALERTWSEIRDRHPEVPDVVLITGTGRKSRSLTLTWGHWNPTRWQVYGEPETTLPEVFLSGERLAQGARPVLSTLLHEAAHGLAHVREIKETSRGHRYHNKRFVALAKEVGLGTTDVPDKTIGFSFTECPEAVFDSYESSPALAEAIQVCIGNALPADEAAPTAGARRTPKYACGCGRVIRIGVQAFEEAPIICGACDAAFLEDLS